jgi:multiple antibiotic resistance protein
VVLAPQLPPLVPMSEFDETLVVFFGVINPIVNIAVFPALARELSAAARTGAIVLCTTVAFGLLLLFDLFGTTILDYLDISIDAFRMAAGILLGLIALRLVDRGAPDAPTGPPARSPADLVVPLATPLMAGPAAIAAAVSYSHIAGRGVTLAAFTAILLVQAAGLAASAPLLRFVPPTVIAVAVRVVGILLLAIAADLAYDGVINRAG